MRVAGHTDLVLFCDRDHALEEVSDALPKPISRHETRTRERRCGTGRLKIPRAVRSVAATRHTASAKHAQDAHVVLNARHPRRCAILDHCLNRLDIAIPLGTLREHYGGMRFAVDMGPWPKWGGFKGSRCSGFFPRHRGRV